MQRGRRSTEPESLDAKRERFERDLAGLSPSARRIEDPVVREVPFSKALLRLATQTRGEMLSRQPSLGSRAT
jgi:hypothetical protein